MTCPRTNCGVTTSAATSAARCCQAPSSATSCSSSSTTSRNTSRRRRRKRARCFGPSPNRVCSPIRRRVANSGRPTSWTSPGGGIPFDDRSDGGRDSLRASRCATERHHQLDQQSADRGAVLAGAAGDEQLLPHRADGLPDHLEPLVDGELEPVPAGRVGPARLAPAGLPAAARHANPIVVDHVYGPELGDQLEPAQRVSLRHPAQRRHHPLPGGKVHTSS